MRTKRLQVALNEDVDDALRATAKAEHRSASSMAQVLIKEALQTRKDNHRAPYDVTLNPAGAR